MRISEIDSSSKGTYAKIVPDSATAKNITNIIKESGLGKPVTEDDLHVTVVFSRKQCDRIKNIKVPLPIVANGKEFDIFDNPDGSKSLVLVLQCETAVKLHNICCEKYGATHDYPEYTPHITLTYSYTQSELPISLSATQFKHLIFDQYIVEELDLE